MTREQIESLANRLRAYASGAMVRSDQFEVDLRQAAAALSGVPQGYVMVPVEKLQRYEVLFETAGLYGMEEKYRDGSQTPNARAHLECAAEIKAMLQEQPVHTSAVPNTSPTDAQD